MSDYYHVKIVKKNIEADPVFAFDLSRQRLEDEVLLPFKKEEQFMCGHSIIRPAEVDAIIITETEIPSSQILKKTRAMRMLLKFGAEVKSSHLIDPEEVVRQGKDVTSELLKELRLPKKKLPKSDSMMSGTSNLAKKDKVFIVHGREDREALSLQKYLRDKLKLDAIVFDDLPDKGRTIIEQIEQIQKNIYYAFVIVTPEDVGCPSHEVESIAKLIAELSTVNKETVQKELLEHLNGRARQNVVFELGLFIGALGRKNVCCLKQKTVRDKPSDIDGVLYKEFDKEVKEVFHELSDELTNTDQ